MSARADRLYSEPTWERFREVLDAWDRLGGFPALARHLKIAASTLERWRLGVTAPHPQIRDKVMAWIDAKIEWP